MRKNSFRSKTMQMSCFLLSIVIALSSPLVAFAEHDAEHVAGEQLQDNSGQSPALPFESPAEPASNVVEGPQENRQMQPADLQGTSGESGTDLTAELPAALPPEQEAAESQAVADVSAAQDQLDELSDRLDSLASLKQGWSDLYSQYALERDELKRLQDEHASIAAKIQKHEEDAERAQAVVDAAHEELAIIEGEGFTAFAMRLIRPSEIESNIYLLHEIIEDRSNVVLSANTAVSGLERAQADMSEKMQAQGKRRLESRSKLNMASCEVEAGCSRARKSMQEALGILTVQTDDQQMQEDVARMQGQAQSAAGRIAETEADLARYYDELDAVSGANGAISFGEGADFAMNEFVFVEKWGKAIDAYLDSYAKGADVPLRSYGRKMAAAAYRYRIDPRLCAAVSIVESGGGLRCIKPHNAWGWGAVDSNPYEGAASWDSFDEAIEQWHKGMADSKTGLATARTVSTLAIVYCSNPAWGADVAETMGKISAAAL